MPSHLIPTDVVPGLLSAGPVFTCRFDYRSSATATLDTVGVSPPTADPSAARRWPIKNPGAKVCKALSTCLMEGNSQ